MDFTPLYNVSNITGMKDLAIPIGAGVGALILIAVGVAVAVMVKRYVMGSKLFEYAFERHLGILAIVAS